MEYTNYRRLGITEMKTRLIKSSTYWTTKLLNETCKKISNKYCLGFYKRKKITGFLISEYEKTGKLTITK